MVTGIVIIIAGCVTFILGLVMVVADHFNHDSVADFFHLEKLVEEDFHEARIHCCLFLYHLPC